jgi:hypothetical protein
MAGVEFAYTIKLCGDQPPTLCEEEWLAPAAIINSPYAYAGRCKPAALLSESSLWFPSGHHLRKVSYKYSFSSSFIISLCTIAPSLFFLNVFYVYES